MSCSLSTRVVAACLLHQVACTTGAPKPTESPAIDARLGWQAAPPVLQPPGLPTVLMRCEHPAPTPSLAMPTGPALRRRRGAVAIDAPVVTGGAVSNAASVVREMGVGFHRCYEAALDQDEALAGAVEIAATLARDGCVESAVTSCGEGLSEPLRECLARRVRGACFAAPAELPATVRVSAGFMPLRTTTEQAPPF